MSTRAGWTSGFAANAVNARSKCAFQPKSASDIGPSVVVEAPLRTRRPLGDLGADDKLREILARGRPERLTRLMAAVEPAPLDGNPEPGKRGEVRLVLVRRVPAIRRPTANQNR